MNHDPLASNPVLGEIVRRLVEAYRPERVYLFGSQARGEAGPDSDYDLLVVVPDDATPEQRDAGLAYRVLWGVGAAVDAVVCTSGWFHARTHLKASLPGTVLREGRLVHAA
ncbi:MAG: nucleotidyltransferase domain-containing protein [Planctomycetes bacterium]|nr:nucleotidyltransferase domain-containing protein [Planctomycetota bacterium]